MLQQQFLLSLFGLSGLLAQNYISSTLIGDGRSLSRDGYTNYGSAAVSSVAGFNKVGDAWVDSERSKIYITDDWGNKIRVFDMKTKYLSTLSGDGTTGVLNGNGNVAKWNHPIGLVVDSAGNLFVSDFDNCCIRKVTQAGVTSTFSGNCTFCGFADGAALEAKYNLPAFMTIDQNDTVYVAGFFDGRIRKVLPDGSVSTFAGGSTMGNIDGPALNARFNNPSDVKMDANGNLFVADRDNHLIRKISVGFVSLYAGSSIGHADGPWDQAKFSYPACLAIDSNGNIFVSDNGNRVIRKINANRTVTTISGTITLDYSIRGFADGAKSESLFSDPRGIHVDSNGTLYVADGDSSNIRVLYPENQCLSGSALCVGQDFKCRTGLCVQRLAGTGYDDWRDGDRLTAAFKKPYGLALDRVTGILYIADYNGNRIRKLTPDGMISTHAGDGTYDFVNGPASSARFRWPFGVAVNSAGIVYVSDSQNHCIRKVADNTVSTLAGECGASGFQDGVGASALFNQPGGLTLDNNGGLFVAGRGNGRIRKIDLSSLNVSTVAGDGTFGFLNGQGTAAKFYGPSDVAFNKSGYLFVADTWNNMIRVISPSGYVSTFAGSSYGLSDGQGDAAMFHSPAGLAFDDNGNLYVADYQNQAVRKISPSGYVSSITNTRNLYGDQSGPALKASFKNPVFIEVDGNGTIYVSDDGAFKIHIICNMTCINGVADCFGNRCKCETGWTGTNCDELIPTTTTSTTSTMTPTVTTDFTTIDTAEMASSLPSSTMSMDATSSTTPTMSTSESSYSSIVLLTSSHSPYQRFEETESSFSITDSSSQTNSLPISLIIMIAAGFGLLIIGSIVFFISYTKRTRSRNRIKINSSHQLVNSNQNLPAAFGISNNYIQSSASYADLNSNGNAAFRSNEYSRVQNGHQINYLPMAYDSFNNTNTEFTFQTTQNVTTSPLCLPGYSALKLGIDFVLPENIDNLGKGGTASIFGGTLINPEIVEKHGLTNIAVKLFPDKFMEKGSAYLYEIAIMNLIPPNPHIVKFIGYMESPRCAIIMKQYEGSLNSLIKDKSIVIDPTFCLKIARDVVTGMNLIHGMNILHLDIKPDNILWDRLQDGSMNFCICDFGFASLVGDSRSIVSGLQVPKSVGVTVRYTAPEVFVHLTMKTKSGRVNSDHHKKIDVYAFGLSMYSVMFGGSFWKDLENDGIVQKIRNGERPSIDSLPIEMLTHADSKMLINIVKECWKQNPLDRPSFNDIANSIL